MEVDKTLKNLKVVYKKYGKEYKSALIKIVVISLFGIITNVATPLLSARFLISFTDSNFKQAILMILIVLAIYCIESIKIFFIRKNNQIFRRGTVRNMQMDLGRQILRLDQTTLDSNSSGKFINLLTSDTEKMSKIFTNGMVIIIKFLSCIGAFIAILLISPQMFLYYIVGSSLLTLLNYVKHQKVAKKEIEQFKASDKVSGLTGELVRGARDIKMLYSKESFMNTLDDKILIQNDKVFEARNIDINYNLFIDYVKNGIDFVGILLLIVLLKNNIIGMAIALAIFNYRNTVLANFMEIVSELLEECKNFNISCNRVLSLTNNKLYKEESFGNGKLDGINGDFEFKNVDFGYNENLVLKNLSFKIKSGETVGIVGKSGVGKSTIFNLLCKLYNINSGQILIDGVDIENLDEESIRGNITIISQNPYIFNMSITDNFKLIKKDVTNEEIKEACKLACLDEFIETLPNKYNTVVGEGGVTLSGGQRQRLAIARALVQNTKIILFDEATSALDNETQTKIQKAIDNLKGNYTIIIIAHRLSTIVNCDKILIIEEGKITDSGTHKKLYAKNNYYKKLCEIELNKK